MIWGDRLEVTQGLRDAGQILNGPNVKRKLFRTTQVSAVGHR